MEWYAAYLLLGAFTGFFAGLFGIGGGLLFVPVLSTLFAAQQLSATHNLHLAIGTSMATILYTAAASAHAHYRLGAVRLDIVRKFTLGLLLGTGLGAAMANHISPRYLSGFFALFMCYVAAKMLRKSQVNADRPLPKQAVLTLVGVGIGAISSLVSIGGGTLSVPFMLRHNIPLKNAIATSAALGIPIALGGTLGYIVIGLPQTNLPLHTLGFVYLPALGLLVAGSMVTASIGAKAAHRLPLTPLRRAFALLLIVLACKMLWQAIA